jgi:SPP1 family predicted phage head-tail adaptor
MQIGKLDQEITIQQQARQNYGGAVTNVWTDYATVFAMVISQKGREAFEAARLNARSTVRMMIRYDAAIESDWRIMWNGEYYNITHIDKSGRRKNEMWITAELSEAE